MHPNSPLRPLAVRPIRAVAVLATTALAVCGLSACADPWASPHPAPTLEGELSAGFLPATPPAPAATVSPSPGSWDGVAVSAGYRVVLLTMGADATIDARVDAVRAWADEVHADLRELHAGDDPVPTIVEAIDQHPDLIVSVGDGLIDPLAIITASHLDQQFLVLGGELAEPTANVIAAEWRGAGFRGEDLGQAAAHDPASFTPERTGRALRAAVAALLGGLGGVVVWVD